MKNLFEKTRFPWYLMLGLSILVYGISILALFLSFSNGESFWSYASISNFVADLNHFYAIGLVAVVASCLIPFGISASNIVKKKLGCFTALAIMLFIIQVVIFVFQCLTNIVPPVTLIFAVVNIFLVVAIASILIVTNYYNKGQNLIVDNSPAPIKKASRNMLICSIAMLVAAVSVLIVPLYIVTKEGLAYLHILGVSGFVTTDLSDTIFFVLFLLLFVVDILLFVRLVLLYRFDKQEFYNKSRQFILYNLVVGVLFFVIGFIFTTVYILTGQSAMFMSYIPLGLLAIIAIVFSVFSGKFAVANGTAKKVGKTKKERLYHIEPLIYFLLFSALTACVLFVYVIKVSYTYGEYSTTIFLNGLDLLLNYQVLGIGYQILAFYVAAMLLVSGILLLLTLMAYLSRHPKFSKILKICCYANFSLMLLLGLSGLYFSIAQQINIDSIVSILALNGQTFSEDITYSMGCDAIYLLLADAAVLSVMLWRSSRVKMDAEREHLAVQGAGTGSSAGALAGAGDDASSSGEGGAAEGGIGGGSSLEEELPNFDPCPAFTHIDDKEGKFQEDFASRQKQVVKDPSLNKLVTFIVDYAKNSRLHLSYSKEDIATFVSGLGACRLTILQGMSGTGKTSLPKIFSEAILGNCELVEVESSWKDKNELLGYYNEFSNLYTPKKFTQALYKATLNTNIPTFIVLDEMNLSRIEYYFSDFLSLMENEEGKRNINLVNIHLNRRVDGVETPYKSLVDGHILHVPANVWFIGTANRDESTFVISDKVYDRAHTMNFTKRAPKIKDFTDPMSQSFYTAEMLESMFDKAKKEGTFDVESSEIITKVEALLRPFNISFGNRILNQIEDFVDIYQACFPKANVQKEAIETILLSKVVAKLEVKTIDNKEDLIKQFENLKLHRCSAFIQSLNED